MSYKTQMYGSGESYRGIIPSRQPNEGLGGPQEVAEGRPWSKENEGQSNSRRTPSRGSEPSGLDLVRQAAKKDEELRFTALLHHVSIDLLRDSYHSLKKKAAPGVEGMTWEEYGAEDLEGRLADLHGRIHRGGYRAKPLWRAYILKTDGRQRPLGIAALADKIAQHAIGTGSQPDLGRGLSRLSYGFRPGRSQQDAWDALYAGITQKKVQTT